MHNNECILMGFVIIVHLFSSIVDKIIFVYNLLYLHPVSRPFPVLNNKCKISPKFSRKRAWYSLQYLPSHIHT